MTKRIASSESTIPEPCVNASLCMSFAVDIRIFFTSAGENDFELSFSSCITNAAVPDTIGADMLVPPNIPNGS